MVENIVIKKMCRYVTVYTVHVMYMVKFNDELKNNEV